MTFTRETRDAVSLLLYVAYLIGRPTVAVSILVACLRLAGREKEDKYVWGGMAVGLAATMSLHLLLHGPRDHIRVLWGLFLSEEVAVVCLIAITALRLHRQGWMVCNAPGSTKPASPIDRVDLWSFALLSGLMVSVSLQVPIFFMFLLFPSIGIPILLMLIAVWNVIIFGSAHIKIEKFLSIAAIVLLVVGASFLKDVPVKVAYWMMEPLTGAEQLEWFKRGIRLPQLMSAVLVTLYLATTLALLLRQHASAGKRNLGATLVP